MGKAQLLTHRPKVGIKVERGLGKRHLCTDTGEPRRYRARHLGMQAAAGADPVGEYLRFVEGICGCLLNRSWWRRPDLTRDAEQPVAKGHTVSAVREPGDPGPPASEREALAQRGRNDGAVGRNRRWAGRC